MKDELIAAIEAGDDEKCVRLLSALDEAARRAVYPGVARLYKDTSSALRNNFGPSRPQVFRVYTTAGLAMLGTATLSELKKASSGPFHGEAPLAILTDRRPGWLVEWVEFELERNFRNWTFVRAMIRAGLIAKPTSDFYSLGMIAAPGRGLAAREFLEQDRDLLDDELWRLFQCEGSGELSLSAYDKYVQEQKSWLEAFRSMAVDGTIDRARVLASTLDALTRDFAPFRAGWYSRLHEALKPTSAELVANREGYLDLLSSRVPATVAFAMRALVEVDKAGGLDGLAVLDRLGAAVEARDKGTAERALSILKRAAQNTASDDVKERIAAAAARALGHPSADVQTSALSLVGNRAALLDAYRPVLAASVRARLEATGETHPTIVAPLSVTEAQHPVVPVSNVEDLTELFAAVLENQGPPVDIERVIDGVARMSAPERLTASLARRAEKLLKRREHPQPQTVLAQLALAWVRGHRVPEPTAEDNLADFLVWRVWCVAEQAALRQERLLLSLPTWSNGRIDPTELARRIETHDDIKAVAADRASLFHLDLIQARLRAGVDLGHLPQPQLTWNKKTWVASGVTYSHHRLALETPESPKRSRFNPALLSTASFRASLPMKRWCATVCPAWREGWFAAGCQDLAYNLDWWEANWSTRAYLETLVEPHTTIGSMGGLLLALGLGAKEAGESMLAVDALVAAVAEDRLSGAQLGSALIHAASSGAIKFARWSKYFGRAAKAGIPQATAIFIAVEALFESGHGKEAADYCKLAELQRELAHQTGLRLTRPGAIKTLETIPTGGKTKRVIAELLNL